MRTNQPPRRAPGACPLDLDAFGGVSASIGTGTGLAPFLAVAKLFIASVADAALAPRAREAIDKAQNALMSVEDILAALLDISKLESGRAAVCAGPGGPWATSVAARAGAR